MSGGTVRVLHLHSSFDGGGKEMRAVRLMNTLGAKWHHTVVSAEDGALGAKARIARGVKVDFPKAFPSLQGKPTPARLQTIARAMEGYDLVLTYNWGAMDAVMAHTLFRDAHKLPPLVHHEDGFNADETDSLKWTRNWFRRIALGKASALVVPSRRLEAIALEAWKQPAGRVKRIPNGVDVAAFGQKAPRDGVRGVIKRPGEYWVGTLAGLRPVKNLGRLVRAFAPLPHFWNLVILGEGSERDAILLEANRLGVGERVHLPGRVEDPERAIGLIDIFALSSDSEQFPLSVVEAMAAGLPVAAMDVGDIAHIVAEENADFVVPAGDENALHHAIARLAEDPEARAAIGRANHARAKSLYDEKRMIEVYRTLYESAMMRGAPGSR